MHAYHQTGKQAELLTLLKDTDAYFHQKDRWNEGAMAALALSCLENKLFAQSVAYYKEVIPLHQRTHPRRGIGNGVLSSYYSHAADAYAGLGKTKEAVDMASGAVVSWAPSQSQRSGALAALVRVLEAAPDLPGYVAELDQEKLQSAVIRKAIGQAYMQKNAYDKALPQLQLAAELQPNDSEINEALLVCFDKLGNKEGAIQQLLQSVELSRRDIKLFAELGKRYEDAKLAGDAERAYTSIVEMQPNESESHTMLAEIRQKQNRWQDAIGHWERVAKIRSLEPTGLLKLAEAQIHERAWDAAAKTLQTLRSKSWPSRFNDVQRQARDLEQKLAEDRKK
jgi:tetratricopeptide (TPR) repeat protein